VDLCFHKYFLNSPILYYFHEKCRLQGLLEEGVHPIAWISGTGAALNCDLPLVNLIGREDRIRFGDGGLHRSRDPGAGAFSPFYDRHNLAVRSIVPGEELFDSYGDDYFGDREAIYGKMPLTENYQSADELLRKYATVRDTMSSRLMPNHGDNSNKVHSVNEDWYGIITRLRDVWPSRTLNALPGDADSVDRIAEKGGTSWLNYNRSIRSLEWLEEHGVCMDSIETRPSTVRQAGRGAFARRFIPRGSVVGPAPVLHFDRRKFAMREGTYDDLSGQYTINVTGAVVHHQLVLNYCWGHRHSTLVSPSLELHAHMQNLKR